MRFRSDQRVRWAAIGAAIAVSAGAGGAGVGLASIGGGERATFVPVEPCRLVDTRSNQNVPGRNSPLGTNDVHMLDVDEAIGKCPALPSATALSLNVTPVNPTADTYLSFVPGSLSPGSSGYDESSNLNPSPSQPPTPNAVEIDLDTEGRFTVYNRYGSVDVVIDVVGYYADHHHDDRYHSRDEVNDALSGKQDAGYSYSKSEVDQKLAITSPVRAEMLAGFPQPAEDWDLAGNYWEHIDTGQGCLNYPIVLPTGAWVDDVEVRFTTSDVPDDGNPSTDDTVVTYEVAVAQIHLPTGVAPDDPNIDISQAITFLHRGQYDAPENTPAITAHTFPHDSSTLTSFGVAQRPARPASEVDTTVLQVCTRDLGAQVIGAEVHFELDPDRALAPHPGPPMPAFEAVQPTFLLGS